MNEPKRSTELYQQLVQALVDEQLESGEVDVEWMRFAEMEQLGHGMGRQLACHVQQALVARQAEQMPVVCCCPECGRECRVERKPKTVQTLDGEIEIFEVRGDCRKCRQSFFPST